MPNWCNNIVELSHENPEMMERAVKSFNDGSFLNEFVPVPKDLQITAGSFGDTPEQKALELQEAANKEKHGYANWYDYCVNEWGTKWDIEPYEPVSLGEDGRLTMSFDSAWSPPCNAYEKLVDLGFSIRAYYNESGMCFAGVWEDGDDDFYPYSDCANSTEVAEFLPEVLDDMFGISQSMAEYEAENEEESEE